MGTKTLTLLVYAFPNSAPATFEFMDVRICGEHAKTAKAEDFISDEGWQQMSDALAAMGKMRPQRELTQLRIGSTA